MISPLTPNEKKLLSAACDIQLQNLVDLHQSDHPILKELINEYDDADSSDIAMEILEKVISFEELKDNPMGVWALKKNAILCLQLIILKLLPKLNYPNAKASLYEKLNNHILTLN